MKTYWERWMIETGSGRDSGRSMLAVRHDDNEDCRVQIHKTKIPKIDNKASVQLPNHMQSGAMQNMSAHQLP